MRLDLSTDRTRLPSSGVKWGSWLPDGPQQFAKDCPKCCRKCGAKKPVSEFRIRRDGPYKLLAARGGVKLAAWCRRCENRYPTNIFQRLAQNLNQRGGQFTRSELETGLGMPSFCYLCGLRIAVRDAELDHVVPIFHGGQTVIENLRWTHRDCNRAKGHMSLDQYLRKIGAMVAYSLEQDPGLLANNLRLRFAVLRLTNMGELARQAAW